MTKLYGYDRMTMVKCLIKGYITKGYMFDKGLCSPIVQGAALTVL